MERMRTETAEKLARWASVGERDAPVAFVGREREIEFAAQQLETWRPGMSRGRTIVAQGAPGAGKTALLGEIEKRLPSVVAGAVSLYLPTPWVEEDVPSLLEDLAVRMVGADEETFRTSSSTETTVGVKATVAARRGRSRTLSPPGLTGWRAFERQFAARADRAKPTMLLVDEIQRLEDQAKTKQLLFSLHDQRTFPLLLVCGGLSTSVARLMKVGLSRLDEAHVLRVDALSLDEAQQSLEEALAAMARDVGGIAGHPDQWARRLARATQGWPRHITSHFRAAAEALLQTGRLAFDDDNLARTLAAAQADMRRYYDRRLEASRTNPAIVYAVYEVVRSREVDADEAADVVDEVAATLAGSSRTRHEADFPTGIHCIDQMLYAGVVAYATSATTSALSIPIPSMATHIANLLSAEKREAVRRTLRARK